MNSMVFVVNMIPAAWSDDVNQDSEPGLSVNPANPAEMVGTAFTYDNPAGGSMVGSLAPIYYSNNGGQDWVLSNIVPSAASSWPTDDITVRYGGSSGVLYGGILSAITGEVQILRTPDPVTPMAKLLDYPGGDQPFVQAATVLGGDGMGSDRVYVPFNDSAFPGLIFSLDATAPAPAGFDQNKVNLNVRPGTGGVQVRVAIHASGVIYGVFYHGQSQNCEVVVVRDNSWGKGNPPFAALQDPSDMLTGKIVAKGLSMFSGNMGQQRLGWSLSIAVDPYDGERIYIAYATGTSPADYTLHVASSVGGSNWSLDRRVVPNATNPSLAINTLGQVGFLYQQLMISGATSNWVTRFERTSDDFASPPETFVLASTPSDVPVDNSGNGVYLGDYVHLQAIGKDFYGIFCANNTPDLNNFPSGVKYQRNHHFPSKKLRATNGVTEIPPSIDPFFFKVEAISAPDDFYVRDWTDSAASHDIGLEPSTNPVFYETSDVWNQWDGATPMINADDQPAHQVPQPGDNYAFVRVSRRAPAASGSPPVGVTAYLLYADFGLGTAYKDISASPQGQLFFAAADASPKSLAAGVKWQLPPNHSKHVCMAVQISTASDPFALGPGGLLGHAPGWPTTDLMVINDNNKAQRNIIFPMIQSATATSDTSPSRSAPIPEINFYVLIENAATYTRDVMIRYEAAPTVLRRLKGMTIGEAGGRRKPFRSGDTGTLTRMQPGEQRWLALTVRGPSLGKGRLPPIRFQEMAGRRVINGASIALQPAPISEVIRNNLRFHLSVMDRVKAIFDSATAPLERLRAQTLLEREQISPKTYLAFFKLSALSRLVQEAVVAAPEASRFRFSPTLHFRKLRSTVSTHNTKGAAAAHSALLYALDALLTTHVKSQGDVADIPLNIRWQLDLYIKLTAPKFKLADSVILRSRSYLTDYEARRVTSKDYPNFIRDLLPAFREAAALVAKSGVKLDENLHDIELSLESTESLQRAHRQFLLKLKDYVTTSHQRLNVQRGGSKSFRR